MGVFLSLVSIVGRGQTAALTALQDFAMQTGAVCRLAAHAEASGELCVLQEAHGNTTLYFAEDSTAESAAEFMSRRLAAPVFYLHIHDGALWLYVLHYKGQVVDQFNPIPAYWDEHLGREEALSWQGNAATVARYVPAVLVPDIENYLVPWSEDTAEPVKAYPTDEYAQEDWQLLDFMKRLQLPYPLAEDSADVQVFRLGR